MVMHCFFMLIILHYIKSTSELFEEFIFTQNETIDYSQSSYFIPFDNQQQLNNIIYNNQYFELINITKTFNLAEINQESKLHIFHYQSSQQLKICIQNRKNIICKFTIDTKLINNELQFGQIHHIFELPFDTCQQIQYISQGMYLVLCKHNQNEYLLIFLKEDGTTQDTMKFINVNDCEYKFDILQNTVLLYSTKCSNIKFWIINIDLEKYQFNSKEIIEQIEFEKDQNLTLGLLQKAQICQNNQVLFHFQSILLKYQINDKTIQKIMIFNHNVFVQTEECNIQFVVGLEGQITQQIKDGQTNIPDLFFPFPLSSIKKYTEINQNLLFQTQNKLIVFHNQELNQTFDSVIDFASILKLPFVITLFSNQTISIIKINQISNLIPYSNAPFMAVLKKSNFDHRNNSQIIYKIKKIDIRNVSQISNIETKRKELFFMKGQPIVIENFYKFFPIFKIDLSSDEINIKVIKANNIKCNIKLDHEIIFKEIMQRLNIIWIFFQTADKFHLNRFLNYLSKCDKNVTSQPLFLIRSEQFQEIIFNPGYVILKNNSSITYIVIQQEQITFKKIFAFEYDINKVFIKYHQVNVILTNGKQYQISILNQISVIENKSQSILKEKQLLIESSSLVRLEKKNDQYFDQIIKLDCQIIDQYHYVNLNRFIIVCLLQDDLISIYLYSYNDQHIDFLYEIPTYNFQIQTPLQITYFRASFCIIARTEYYTGIFLLFYNIQQKYAIKSLYQIKHIKNHNNIKLMRFSSENYLVQCQENYCEAINLNSELIQFDQHKLSDQYQIKSEVILRVSSFVFQEQREIVLLLSCFNQDQYLRFRLDVKLEAQFLQNNPQNQLIGAQKIFGQIDNITVSKECQGQLTNPIEYINKITFSFACSFIQDQFCFNSEQLMYDIFGINIVIFLPQDIISIKIILQDKNQLNIFYLNQNDQFKLLIVDDWNQQKPKLTSHKLNVVLDIRSSKFHHIGNILYTQNEPIIIVLNQTDYSHILAYKKFEEIKSDVIIIYVEKYDDNQFKYTQISKANNDYLAIIQFCVSNQNIERTLEIQSKVVQSFDNMVLHKVQKDRNLLKLRLIIHQYQSLVEKSQSLLYYFEIIFDLQSSIIVEEKITHYFRTQQKKIKNIQILNNFLVSSGQHSTLPSKKTIICLYDLSLDSLKLQFNDYFYSTEIDSKETLQNYNESYQIIWNEIDVNLVKIQMYQLHLHQQQKQCQIQLNNQVSTITIFAQNFSFVSNQKLLYAILVLNFAFITFALFKKNKKRRLR